LRRGVAVALAVVLDDGLDASGRRDVAELLGLEVHAGLDPHQAHVEARALALVARGLHCGLVLLEGPGGLTLW